MRSSQPSASPPARGAWIEILTVQLAASESLPSPPARGAWIEIIRQYYLSFLAPSPPARGAWIEILDSGDTAQTVSAPLPVWGAAFYDYH